ncbi:FAD-dependent oxidoreductase [Ectothiorhodospiraceae bacterium 2226]|nr:FAD-dependent oxidoreductase [Ectothiorhodospiraceae bacterium 2226]
MKTSRRQFFRLMGAGGALALAPWAGSSFAQQGGAQPHVVVIGGGFGGATCAKYLRRFDPNIRVTLVEVNDRYVTCPGSNWVLGGLRQISDITQRFDALGKHGVEFVQARATRIDPERRRVQLDNGQSLTYDRLVIAPGIGFDWDAVEGYSPQAAISMPHAWRAGLQTERLRKALEEMRDGGTFIMRVPPAPFRCPPGPYERASMVAHYFKQHKPRSKILILDSGESFSKQGLFEAGWNELYGDMIEWMPGSQGGQVTAVDANTRTLRTDQGDHRGDVVNFIPAQKAGEIAEQAGLTNEQGWCNVNQATFESMVHPGIHVIGDASVAGAMPKSGHSANNQAKMTAAAIIAMMRDQEVPSPSHVNTCYSLVAPDYGISVAAVYRLENGSIAGVEGAGGVSPADVGKDYREAEARYTLGWYASITEDTWG